MTTQLSIKSPEPLTLSAQLSTITFTHHMMTDDQRKHYESAINYVASHREKRGQGDDKTYPLNRGDILLLVMLIDQEMKAANPAADLKRLAAMRGKLGDLVFDAPEMSKEEAQQFR
jgi:hypothetical protein